MEELVHWIVGANCSDWDGIGTHPSHGIAPCRNQGRVTDCASMVSCSECHVIMRGNGITSQLLQAKATELAE